MPEDPAKKPTLFGRQKTKKLSARQQALLKNLLPELRLNPKAGPACSSRDRWLNEKPLWLEIGFGGGEHLAAMAGSHPDVQFIGCEPFLNGVAKLLVAIEEQGLQNIKIYDHDARHVLAWLPPESLARLFILYPDPWPKKRHQKRRLVTRETLKEIAKVMKPGGQLLIASDIPDYIRTSLLAVKESPEFTWAPSTADDWKSPPKGWPGTRYEQKAIREGRIPTYLKITRNQA